MRSRVQRERLHAGYVAASFDGVTLVLDQQDVPEVREAKQAGTEDALGTATVEYQGAIAPVYRLSNELREEHGPTRQFVLIVLADNEPFGVACDRVRTFSAPHVRLEPLPASMHSPESAGIAIAYLPNEIGFHCPTPALSSMLLADRAVNHGARNGDL